MDKFYIKELIGEGDFEAALSLLYDLIKQIDKDHLSNDYHKLKGRFSSFEKDENAGELTTEKKTTILNKLRGDLLEFVDKAFFCF